MPIVSYALMSARGVTMSVPSGAQFNDSLVWQKKSTIGLDQDRIPSRPHSAAIHFNDHPSLISDKEITKTRRHSLSPNFIVKENDRLVK